VREVTERRSGKGIRLGGLATLVTAGFLALSPAAGMANEFISSGGGTPAKGHAQVVAQAVVDLPGGQSAWRIADGSVDAAGASFVAKDDGFLVSSGGVLLVTDSETGRIERLAYGEAMAVRDGVSYEQIALGEDEASFFVIALGEDLEGSVFEGKNQELAGLRDLDLLRDQLDPEERAEIPAGGGKVVVLATTGELKVLVEGEKSVTLKPGKAAEFEGDIELVAGKNSAASFVAAVVGDLLQEAGAPAADEPSASDDDVSSDEPASIPADELTAGPHVEDTADPDGDGIGNTIENQIGTDRDDPDTDGDGLDDGSELYVYGTDPLNPDSDLDELPDGDEVYTYFSDPMNVDSDGDNLMDVEVLLYGTNPNDPDSDHDGWSDLDEVGADSQPLIPDTDGDSLLDGEEVHDWGTNPFKADTDGDGASDMKELSDGTDPLDPNSFA
jgi:hypothetical protein